LYWHEEEEEEAEEAEAGIVLSEVRWHRSLHGRRNGARSLFIVRKKKRENLFDTYPHLLDIVIAFVM